MFFILLFGSFNKFNKKLLNLLMLEGCMIILISLVYLSSYKNPDSGGMFSFFVMLFLVLDSVFGLCLLSSSSRFSTSYTPFTFSL